MDSWFSLCFSIAKSHFPKLTVKNKVLNGIKKNIGKMHV